MVSFHHRYLNEAAVLHEQFRTARVARRWTIDRVAHTLAISQSYIQAIEEGRWSALPGGVYTRQFIERYADLLGLDMLSVRDALGIPRMGAALASLERRRLDVPTIPRAYPMYWHLVRVGMIVGAVALMAWYFGTRLTTAFQAPSLTIESPESNLVLTSPLLEVRGASTPEAALTMNEMRVPLRPDGRFETRLVLLPGQNTIRFVATRRHGKSHIIERVVTVVQQRQE